MTTKDLWIGEKPEEPLFSVVIPAYEARSSVQEAVESALDNEVSMEILVVDDGSSEPVQPVDLPRGPVCLVQRDTNGGSARARNSGIRRAGGRWIAFLDADDVYESGRLDAAGRFLASRKDLDGMATDTLVVSVDGSSRRQGCRPNTDGILDHKSVQMAAALIYSRKILGKVGPFDPRWTYYEDGDLWMRMLTAGAKIGWISRPAYVYRLNETGKASEMTKLRLLREGRDVNLVNALRPKVVLEARARLLVRALRLERSVMLEHWNRLSSPRDLGPRHKSRKAPDGRSGRRLR